MWWLTTPSAYQAMSSPNMTDGDAPNWPVASGEHEAKSAWYSSWRRSTLCGQGKLVQKSCLCWYFFLRHRACMVLRYPGQLICAAGGIADSTKRCRTSVYTVWCPTIKYKWWARLRMYPRPSSNNTPSNGPRHTITKMCICSARQLRRHSRICDSASIMFNRFSVTTNSGLSNGRTSTKEAVPRRTGVERERRPF